MGECLWSTQTHEHMDTGSRGKARACARSRTCIVEAEEKHAHFGGGPRLEPSQHGQQTLQHVPGRAAVSDTREVERSRERSKDRERERGTEVERSRGREVEMERSRERESVCVCVGVCVCDLRVW